MPKKLAADRESKKRKRAEELPEQRQTRLAAKRESEKEGLPKNHKNSKKTGLRLIEKVRKESVLRNHKSNLSQCDAGCTQWNGKNEDCHTHIY